MELHIDPSIRVPPGVLQALIREGFVGVDSLAVEVRVQPAPLSLRRWVRVCQDAATCSRPIDFQAGAVRGHSASARRGLQMLDATLHGPAREVAMRPQYAYTGRVRDRRRYGVTRGSRFLVTLRVPSDPEVTSDSYPRVSRDPRRRESPALRIENWREEVVRVAAHEACHVRQYGCGLPRSEVEAEQWAQVRLEGYRSGRARANADTAAAG